MESAARVGQMQVSSLGGDEPQWLQVSLARTQLLSVRFAEHIYARAVSGLHWISADGVDYSIGPGERVTLPAGLALIAGEGVLQLALAKGNRTCQSHVLLRWFNSLLKRRAMALEIDIC